MKGFFGSPFFILNRFVADWQATFHLSPQPYAHHTVYMHMIRMVLGITIGMLLHFEPCWGQDVIRSTKITTDSTFNNYQFVVDVPMGQSFVNKGQCHSKHTVRFRIPDEDAKTKVQSDTLGDLLRTHVMMMGANTESYMHESEGPAGRRVVMRGSYTAGGDPTQYISEILPALNQQLDLRMHLGHGGAWLDLSDLRTRKVMIESSASDVFVTYNKPNLERMKILRVNSGMGNVTFRNLEYARAEKVLVTNGMGETRILLGEKSYGATWMEIGVGSGRCLMMVHKEAPVKIVIKGTFFSSVEIPDDFMETGDDTYVNLAYKRNPEKGMTAVVDPGLGSFTLVNYE